ncbi:MAG: hypothetical protein HRU09_02755 [Oligoflexales bacterium]|nr:hypothetical protein [Oligoflexales bacterium]
MLQQQGLPTTSNMMTKIDRQPYGVYEEGFSLTIKLLMAVTIATCTIAAFASVLGLFAFGWSNNFSSVFGFLP